MRSTRVFEHLLGSGRLYASAHLLAGHPYWILEQIEKLKHVDPKLAGELENAAANGRLFGLLSVAQVDEVSGAVADPQYIVKAFDEIGDFAF